jgi:hypothetical protein
MDALRELVKVVKREEQQRDSEKCYYWMLAPFQLFRKWYFASFGAVIRKFIYALLLCAQITLSATSTFYSTTHTDIWLKGMYVSVTVFVAALAAVPVLFATDLPRL